MKPKTTKTKKRQEAGQLAGLAPVPCSAPFWIPVNDEMERETHLLFLSRAEGDWSWEVWGGYFSGEGEWVIMPDHGRLKNKHLEPIFYAHVDPLMVAPVSLLPNNQDERRTQNTK